MSNFVVAWDESGNIARTFNYLSPAPTWESIKGSMSGAVNDAAYNWQSAYITSGYVSGALGMYVVTASGTTLRVYYSSDVRAVSVSWTLQATFTMSDSTVISEARIASSKTQAGFAIVAWKDRTGTRIARTTDGSTWGSAVQVGSAITDSAGNDNKPIGLAVDGVKQLVTAPDNTGKYFLYLATSTGGSFSKMTGSTASDEPYPAVTIDSLGKAYVGVLEAGDLPPVDYDWCVYYPFVTNSYWQLVDPTQPNFGSGGAYVSGSGWQLTNNDTGNHQNKLMIRKQFSSLASIVRIVVEFDVQSVGVFDPQFDGSFMNQYSGTAFRVTVDIEPTTGIVFLDGVADQTNDLRLFFSWDNDDTIQYVRSVTLYGTGTEPVDTNGETCA
jgi:hypothetical protein